MNFLNWMGDHPVLTVVLLILVADGLYHIVKAARGND